MRHVLAPKVAVVEEDTAVAEKDKVVADEDKVAVEAVTVVVEEDEGVADKDQRVVVAPNYRYSTHITNLSQTAKLQICLIVSVQDFATQKYLYCKRNQTLEGF
jgi:hypothetical protein